MRALSTRYAAPLMALGDVAFAPAVAVGVDGHAKRVIALVDRAADMVVDPFGVAAHIELEDFEALAGGFGGFVEPRLRDRRKNHAVAVDARRFSDSGAPGRIEYLQRADRCAQHRDAQLLAEQCAAAIDVRHVAQDPRPKAYRIKREPVARQGRFCLRAADQIVPIVAIEIDARPRDEFVKVLKTIFERLRHDVVLPR